MPTWELSYFYGYAVDPNISVYVIDAVRLIASTVAGIYKIRRAAAAALLNPIVILIKITYIFIIL